MTIWCDRIIFHGMTIFKRLFLRESTLYIKTIYNAKDNILPFYCPSAKVWITTSKTYLKSTIINFVWISPQEFQKDIRLWILESQDIIKKSGYCVSAQSHANLYKQKLVFGKSNQRLLKSKSYYYFFFWTNFASFLTFCHIFCPWLYFARLSIYWSLEISFN